MEYYERKVICEHNEFENSKRFQLNIYLAHKASVRKTPTKEGFTHDWMVMLRSDDGVKVHNLIDKVVFRLHPTFPNPKRGFKSPPYQVVESGYGGFTFPIDVHLKNDGEPKVIRFMYTLYLGVTPSVSHCRCEKIIFENPSSSFADKLFYSGANILELTQDTFGAELNQPRSMKRAFIDETKFQIGHETKRKAIHESNDIFFRQKIPSTQLNAPAKTEPARKRGRPKKNSKVSTREQNKENVFPSIDSNFKAASPSFDFPSFLHPGTPSAERSRCENSQSNNLSLSMNSFVRNIQSDPCLTSTPISSRSILKNSANRKSNLKLRFKSYVEEYSLGDEEKVILEEGMHEYRKKLMEKQARLAPLKDLSNYSVEEASKSKNDDLLFLQRTLMNVRDRKILKKVVKIIDEAGHLKTTTDSIDFDLCALDDVTLEKVRQCLIVSL